MDRRYFLIGGFTALLVGVSRAESNFVQGGGFVGGSGSGNVIRGDATTALNAVLNNCVVNGRGAAARTVAASTSFNGDGCGADGDFIKCDLTGQYTGHFARMRNTVARGYASGEYSDIESGALNGLYAGHSMWGRAVTADGQSALIGAIVSRTVARGRNAGHFAEGEDLVMIGDAVTTNRVPGAQMAVSEIMIGEDKTPWVVRGHGLGEAGKRVNLFLYGDEMPMSNHGPFVAGHMRPFVILGKDEIGYAGDKYRATSLGKNIRVAINTCRPKRSTAIGEGSVIRRDDQLVINGVEITDARIKARALEARQSAVDADKD